MRIFKNFNPSNSFNSIKEEIKSDSKPRLFVDMDGTLAEWRNIHFDFENPEDICLETLLKKLDEVLYLPGYFRTLKPYENVLQAIRDIIDDGEIDVYILSCYKAPKNGVNPMLEKNNWLDHYLPEIDDNHRIFVPDGHNKTVYIPGGLKENDYLLDDYTKNLLDFETSLDVNELNYQGKAIKLLNNVNESKGTWQGSKVSYESKPSELARDISNIVLSRSVLISHPSPEKEYSKIMGDEFIEKYKNISLANNVAIFKNDESVPKMFQNWSTLSFRTGQVQNDTETSYTIYYENENELFSEIVDTKNGNSQGIIPDSVLSQLEEYLTEENERC